MNPHASWSEERAAKWRASVGWLVGANFIPSNAVNQLEMWQADTFDPTTIDRELGWAAEIGFNSMRVFLHDLLWKQDAEGFLRRMDRFLEVADGHGIGAMFVLFDGVWDPNPELGAQRSPRPHIHNPGWVQGPGRDLLGDPGRHDELKPYVQGVLARFAADRRVHAWDLFNEPDNPNPAYLADELSNKAEMASALLEKAFGWAREMETSQPLTCGVWFGDWSAADGLRPIERLSLESSDFISFHSYDRLEEVTARIGALQRYGRPLLCTEYMARGAGSTFDPVLGRFKEQDVGAYNWGFVAGRTQTNYPWDSWVTAYDGEPTPWFHDILRSDGAPYDPPEVEYIKSVIGHRRTR